MAAAAWIALAACAATSPAPETPPVAARAPIPGGTSTGTCTEGRITICDCAAGKGYRPCTEGQPGPCVCTLPGDPVARSEAVEARTDPRRAPNDVAAPPPDAHRTASGLAYRILRRGSGNVHPTPSSRVTVQYSGWTSDGKLFDSSYDRHRPASFVLQHLIAGWVEGVQLLVVGDRARFWIPESLAYQGKPGRPQGMLVFDVELIAIQ